AVMVLVWVERKVTAAIQLRYGPMRTGKWGLAQTLADTLKLILKEDIVPKKADRMLFLFAPIIVFIPAYLTYLVLPVSPDLITRDLNIGLFYFLAIPSISALGLLMAGWGSNSKYPLIGGIRSAAQMVSYEIPRALSLLGIIMLAGTLSMTKLVELQNPYWFILLQPLGFIIFFISSLAEINRIPFDIPVAESELVQGYFTEYSGIRFALFQMAEYAHMVGVSLFLALIFLGGWHGPFLPSGVWLFLKTFFFILIFMWVGWTFPRFKAEQLMRICWKMLIPLALFNIAFTGILMIVISNIVRT
ncbi:MAG: NADH-quinone oxidoreductase subunit NuoH, partial [Actinomycetia bacterium]|nr:NADH-quinone oxidoreductase subunit NuoH [Actinomycetes bacterium]